MSHGYLLESPLDAGIFILHLTVFYHPKTKDSPKLLNTVLFPLFCVSHSFQNVHVERN